MGLQSKFLMGGLFIPWECIVWLTKPILWFKICFTCQWWTKLLSTLYNYFCKNLKRHLEFTKLTKVMETKRVKILKIVKTLWINMLSLAKHVMAEYRTLLMKMAIDIPSNEKKIKIWPPMWCASQVRTCYHISLAAVCSQFHQVQLVEGCLCLWFCGNS